MKEVSAGGVVYKRENGQLLVQVIEDRYGHITLAKGKQEAGETLEETALREVLEETGIVGKVIKPLATIHYQYHHPDGQLVDKEVHYYLIEALTDKLTTQQEEINDVSWRLPAEAWQLQQQKGYDNNQSVWTLAFQSLGIVI